MASEREGQAADRLPVIHVSLTLRRSFLTQRHVGFFQDVTSLWIDEPADGGAGGVHVDNACVDVADLLGSSGVEKHVGIFPVRSDEKGIALDLLKRFCFLRSREVAHALARYGYESCVRRYYDVHRSRRSLHFRVQMIGIDNDGFH